MKHHISSVALTAGVVTLMAAERTGRKGLFLQNQGSGDAWLGGSDVAVGEGIKVLGDQSPFDSWTDPSTPAAYYGVAESDTTFTVDEIY